MAEREREGGADAAGRADGSGRGPVAGGNYRFFSHTACEFHPCHIMPDGEELNCLFCFCPLYALGPRCGGNFRYVGDAGDIKDCSACTLPHRRENYDYIMSRFELIKELAAPRGGDAGDNRDGCKFLRTAAPRGGDAGRRDG